MSRQLGAGVLLQPVLQLADAPRPLLAATPPAAAVPPRYRITLSDGAHLQLAVLATSLNDLVTGGALRRGAVIRVLEYVSDVIDNRRFIIVIQLEILHAQFAPIGNPTFYEDNVTHHFGVSYSGGLGSNELCFMPGAQQVVSSSSCLPGHDLLGSSSTTSAKPAVNSLPFGECLSSMPASSTVDVKMQQLSLNDHQNERFAVNATGDAFVPSGNTSGNPRPPSNLHSTPMYMDRFHIARNESPLCIIPINALNPYRERWKIKARVTAKTDLKHFTNPRGPGKVFSFDLLDAKGGEVRATCFNLQAEQYFDLIEVDKVYLISEGSLRPAQKKFNPLNNDYEIFVDHKTSMEICSSDDGSIPTVDVKMQQLSLNDHQNERFAVNATGAAFVPSGNTSGNPRPPSNLHSTPMYMDRFHIARNESPFCIIPINSLNPYRERWKIKARVTAKTDLKHFTSAKGPGKVFFFDLLDTQGGEVRATCFNTQADQYFNLIEVDKVYLISKGSLKPKQKFNSLNNDYEILVDHRTTIEICCGDETSFIRHRYNFRQINEIENMEIGAIVDLVGIVTSVGPSAMLMRKDGTKAKKRPLQLIDMSGRSVEIVFWGKFCDAEGHQLQLLSDSGSNPVLALKGGRISDFSGRSVVTISSTQLKVNPDLPVAEGLKQWYMTGGKTAPCVSLSQDISSVSRIYVQKTIAQIKDDNLGRSDKPDFITVRAAISHVVADKFCYPACTLELNGKRCYRKVSNNGDGTWYCYRCNQRSENCEYRYLLLCQIKDHTGTTYATAFQEAASEIVGHTAQELFMIQNVEQDHLKFAAIMEKIVSRKCLFKLRVNAETFNGEQRVKCVIVGVEKLDAADIDHNLLEKMDNLWNVLKGDVPDASDVSYANLEATQTMPTSNNTCGSATGVGGPECGISNRMMPTPASASSQGFVSDDGFVCFRCGQAGHWAKDCVARTA